MELPGSIALGTSAASLLDALELLHVVDEGLRFLATTSLKHASVILTQEDSWGRQELLPLRQIHRYGPKRMFQAEQLPASAFLLRFLSSSGIPRGYSEDLIGLGAFKTPGIGISMALEKVAQFGA